MKAGPCIAAILALLSFLLLIPVFCWHCKKQNIPVVTLVFWSMFGSLTTFINLVLWSGDDFYNEFSGYVYCDITNKLEFGSNVGRICAVATLSLNLYMILKAQNRLFLDEMYRRRKNWLNFALCWVTPIFTMSTVYIIQSQRFILLRYRGCTSVVAGSYPTVLIVFLWQILWSFVAVIFATLSLYQFYITRRDIKNILRCTNCGLSFKRFARLVIFSTFCLCTLVPLTIYTVVVSLKNFQLSFDWKFTHDWSPTIFKLDVGFVVMYDKLIGIGIALITFIIFGVGSESNTLYFKWFKTIFRKKKQRGETFDNSSYSQLISQSQMGDLDLVAQIRDLESNSYSMSFIEDGKSPQSIITSSSDQGKNITPVNVNVISVRDKDFFDSEILECEASPGNEPPFQFFFKDKSKM